MRNRFQFLLPILDYLGALFWMFGFVLMVPFAAQVYYAHAMGEATSFFTFLLPAAMAFVVGFLLKRNVGFRPLSGRGAMMLCAFGWVAVSALGALPFSIGLGTSYLDAYFEAVSGFTTTGITVLQGLDEMPRSVLLWRSLIQWLGGLGILTFFLAVIATRGSVHALYSAETHKIFAKRPVPGLFNTLRILWAIYAAFTALSALLLVLEGMSFFDAVCHSMTALSTGGYSPHDASIGFYRLQGYKHYVAIEYTVTAMMFLGGVNFFIHYRVLTGGIRALWDNLEMRLWWSLLFGSMVLVAGSRFLEVRSFGNFEETIRCSLFQVVSLATTTGFATKDISAPYFTPLARQIFLILMVIGGCVGSTGGGIKVMRIGVMLKMVGRQIRHIVHGRSAVTPVIVDGEVVESEELRRVAALFFAWMVLIALGAGVTAVFSMLGPMEAASGMFSALGNIGPCYISGDAMTRLHPAIKMTYIVGMLAGRLEILPILLIFSRRAWK